MSATETRRLETLHRLCRRKGWTVALRSSGDSARTRILYGDRSRLLALDVVEPGVGDTRRRRLLAGDVVARVRIGSPVEIELAAATIITALVSRGLFDETDAA